MKLEIVKHSHSVGESNFHYQITPAYRRPIFVDERVRKLTQAYLLAKAQNLNVVIVSVNFGPDHMYFFVGNCKNFSAAKLIGEIKGYISFVMRKYHKKLFERFLWETAFGHQDIFILPQYPIVLLWG